MGNPGITSDRLSGYRCRGGAGCCDVITLLGVDLCMVMVEAGVIRVAGFIILDGIRMLCEKMYTLILHFNFYTNIILVFKFIKGILFFLDLNGETRGKNNAL